MEASIMKTPKPVTPAEAKIVWATLRNPSARRVAKALSQAGRRIHHSTIARWRAQGWRAVAQGVHPLEAARQAVDVAATVLTGNAAAGAEVLERRAEDREQLEGLTDRELLRRAARELCITIILVSQEFQSQLLKLVAEQPMETGVLLQALTQAVSAAGPAFLEALDAREPPKPRCDNSVNGSPDDPTVEMLKNLAPVRE
jgi:hypothetical protein